VFGAIRFEARIDADRDTRRTKIRGLSNLDARFADGSDEPIQKLAKLVEGETGRSDFSISVDQQRSSTSIAAGEKGDYQRDVARRIVGEVSTSHTPPKGP
jgi:hypothetical protein